MHTTDEQHQFRKSKQLTQVLSQPMGYQTAMSNDFKFTINSIAFDENYQPADSTRITTNFANLARGESRQQNLRNTLTMINNRFNALAQWDNPTGDRYSVELDITSVNMDIEGKGDTFPTIEILKTTIVDHVTQQRIPGIVGNNFSSYVRDYDFSALLLAHNKDQPTLVFQITLVICTASFFSASLILRPTKKILPKQPVICLSVSDNKTYLQTTNQHPILGVEYQPNETSLTEQYFKKMGLDVRYFMPPNSVAPWLFSSLVICLMITAISS